MELMLIKAMRGITHGSHCGNAAGFFSVLIQMKCRHKRENKEHRPRKQMLNIHSRDATYVTSITSGKEAGT